MAKGTDGWMFLTVAVIISHLIGCVHAEFCATRRGLSLERKYCSHGCCGNDDSYCCPNVGLIAGCVVAGIVVVVVAIVIYIIVRKNQTGRLGAVVQPAPATVIWANQPYGQNQQPVQGQYHGQTQYPAAGPSSHNPGYPPPYAGPTDKGPPYTAGHPPPVQY